MVHDAIFFECVIFFVFVVVILCQKLSEALVARNTPIRGISILVLAIRTLQTDPRQLPSIHSTLLEICLTSSNLKAALPFLIDDFEDFSSEVQFRIPNASCH